MAEVALSFGTLSLLLLVGKILRTQLRVLQSLYLPASVIGGVLGLCILGPFGAHVPSGFTLGWSSLPGVLINIVFAVLFLGAKLPSVRTAWNIAGPQLAYGQIVALGQYVVGIALVLLLLGPIFGVPALFGVIVPVGFEGGHGTAAGLAESFRSLNWPEGRDLGLASATVGMISAIIVGIGLLNWAARRGHVTNVRSLDDVSHEERGGILPVGRRPIFGYATTDPASIDTLAFHVALVGLAILIGAVLKQGLVLGAGAFGPAGAGVFRSFPLFPLCMIGGLFLQSGLQRLGRADVVDSGHMHRIGGFALDFLVVAAISTIRLETIGRDLAPFLLLCLGGILWNVFCVVWLARRLLPTHWFERAIAEMGQSMGVTATGLLLLRAADPEGKTDAPTAFGYKQMLHEPFMGGGLFTSTAVLMVATQGGWFVLLLSAGLMAAWLVVWAILWRKR